MSALHVETPSEEGTPKQWVATISKEGAVVVDVVEELPPKAAATSILSRVIRLRRHRRKPTTDPDLPVSRLTNLATQQTDTVLTSLNTTLAGLNPTQVATATALHGRNTVDPPINLTILTLIVQAFVNPFSVVLLCLAIIAVATGDHATFAVIMAMIVISAGLRFWQDVKSSVKVKRLASNVKTNVHVRRSNATVVVDSADLVPGDILELRSGDLIPADCILLESSSLSVSQSMLTGEALPVDKAERANKEASLWSPNVLLSGTSVAFGQGIAVVATTGKATYLASMGCALAGPRKANAFEKTVRRVSYLLIGVTCILAPVVLVVQGTINKADGWKNALLFALSVAVGLTPEMLPVVINANLARGAILLGRRNVLVKRLDGVQNLGGVTTLCTDKTGTLTVDKVQVAGSVDLFGDDCARPLDLAAVNATLQTGARSILDAALVSGAATTTPTTLAAKVHEIPFDSCRRMLTVVVEDGTNYTVITKGAVDEVLAKCTKWAKGTLDTHHRNTALATAKQLNNEGLRLVAVATRTLVHFSTEIESDDTESGLTLVGFVSFLDPPKDDAKQAIVDLHKLGISVKILTGDAPEVALKVACQVGLVDTPSDDTVLTGERLATLGGELPASDILQVVRKATVLAKLSPFQKRQVVELLQEGGEAVGMMGDGVNDALALQAADVGISVDTGTEVAKSASDIILLEKSLAAVVEGVTLGRRSMVNTIKYFKMTLSSNVSPHHTFTAPGSVKTIWGRRYRAHLVALNHIYKRPPPATLPSCGLVSPCSQHSPQFGNVFSIMAASFWLPYQPMLPLQILIQNILYDLSQSAIPFDNVDDHMVVSPVQWSIMSIVRFIVVFGPTSSVFDIATFTINQYYWSNTGVPVRQTHWFMEGSITQTLVVFVLRTDLVPMLQSRPSHIFAGVVTTMLVVAQVLPWIPGLNKAFSLVHPELLFYPFLVGVVVCYCALVQAVKVVYKQMFNEWF